MIENVENSQRGATCASVATDIKNVVQSVETPAWRPRHVPSDQGSDWVDGPGTYIVGADMLSATRYRQLLKEQVALNPDYTCVSMLRGSLLPSALCGQRTHVDVGDTSGRPPGYIRPVGPVLCLLKPGTQDAREVSRPI